MHFGELAIGAWVNHIVEACKAEIAHQPHGFCQRIVVGENGAAFEAVEYLGGMEAQYLAAPKIADACTTQTASKGMRGIKHQLKFMLGRDLLQFCYGSGTPPQVDADNSRRVGRDAPSHRDWVEVVGCRIDVGKNRRDTLP